MTWNCRPKTWNCRNVIAGLLPALLLAAQGGSVHAQQMQQLPPIQGAQGAGPPGAKGKSTAAPSGGSAASSGKSSGGAGTSSGKGASKAESASAGSEGGIGRRVDQLEEQLVDLQVVIGTLESLAKSGGGAGSGASAPAFRPSAQPSGGAYSASDAARIDGLETQIRALTAQLEQLATQVRALDGRRGEYSPPGGPSVGAAPPSRFGSTTVTTDPIGSMLSESSGQLPPPQRQGSTLPPQARPGGGAVPVSTDPGASKQAYEAAYASLLQQDYGAAEAGFDDFLKRYPADPLAANAQYWLGESFFVRGQFKPAAAAFLKGYQSYGKSAKAPDSLLKLAMSLDRLGQRDAACSSYAELASRFPTAPTHIKNRAQTERQRIGCA